MPGASNVRETIIFFGRDPQSAIGTANIIGEMWRLDKSNADLFNPEFVTENNAEDIGKGHEFIEQVFPVNWDVAFTFEKFLSSQIVPWFSAFGLGQCVKTGTGPWVYTCTPNDPPTDGIELSAFSFAQQIRPSLPVVDLLAIGCVIDSFLVSVGSGPGRANSTVSMEIVGTGKLSDPSGLTAPARLTENLLPSASLAVTINGTDYVTNKNIVSLEWGWQNNHRLDSGFFPGSGVQDGAAIRGRMEFGDRVPVLSFVARLDENSDEFAKLKAQTTGTAVITQTFDANETYTATFHEVAFQTRILGETDGLVTVEVSVAPQFDSVNGVLTVAATTNTDGIFGL